MFWKVCVFLLFIALGGTRGEESPNLAWELINGFMYIWNHTDQGICIPVPKAPSQDIMFTLIPVNLTIWVNSLQTEQNGMGFMLKSPFEYQPNNNFASYGGWRTDEAAFYEVPSSITPTYNDKCKWWRLEVSSANVLNTTNQACPQGFEQAYNVLGLQKTRWSITGCASYHNISCSQVPFCSASPETTHFELQYTEKWTPTWCILLPNRKGTYSSLDRKSLAWGWSVK